MMLGRYGTSLCLSALLSLLALSFFADASSATTRLCALRDGPRGPCTCQTAADAPGQFSVAPKSRCRSAQAAAKAEKKPESEDAARETEAVAHASPSPEERAGDATHLAASPIETAALPTGSRLDQVRTRGKLLCGVNTRLLGFSAQTETGTWAGLDVDFCHALAAATLGDASKVEFISLETNERFDALKDGRVDVLSRNTTWNMDREVGLGLSFAGILYFDGQGFLTANARGLVSAQQLAGSTVCVEAGTTTEANIAYYFKAQQIDAETKVLPTREATLKAYLDGECDAYSGDRSSLFSDRASFEAPGQHDILPEVISKEPLGPAVFKGDDEWAAIVRWTLAGLINAEEVDLDRASAAGSAALSGDADRLIAGAGTSGEKLRLDNAWLRNAVAAVGNYGEMFDANVGKGSPLGMERGLNALWKRGGILSAPPMW